eukprot:2918476-Ditylum_brightwellii.AAC.1
MKVIGQKSHATRSKLKKEVNWDEWLAVKKKKLDKMHKCQIYGNPVRPPNKATILQSIWTYVVKHDSKKKARNCCNGSILKRKGTKYVNTYSACASQSGMQLLTAIAAIKNYLIIGTDATNVYAQSPPPSNPTCMRINDQYAD